MTLSVLSEHDTLGQGAAAMPGGPSPRACPCGAQGVGAELEG